MKISCGSKRIALLVGGYAIKIGKIRLFRCFMRIFFLPFSAKSRKRYLGKYGGTWTEAILNDIFAGLHSNQNEYRYYQLFHDPRVMPTIARFLWAHIIVQNVGTPVSDEEIERRYPNHRNDPYKNDELDTPRQYCRDSKGDLKICDYGEKNAVLFLQQTLAG